MELQKQYIGSCPREKVSIRKCDDYDDAFAAVSKCFEDLGGIDIPKDSRVVIKTNLLKMNRPNEMVTTHPKVIEAVIRCLQEAGINDIVIADSPGGPFNSAILKGVYTMSGMDKVAKDTGVRLNYNTESTEVFNEKGVILKQLDFAISLKKQT